MVLYYFPTTKNYYYLPTYFLIKRCIACMLSPMQACPKSFPDNLAYKTPTIKYSFAVIKVLGRFFYRLYR